MKNKLLFTTALAAVAFAATGASAEDKIFNAETGQSLQDYAKSDEAHAPWVDNVTIDNIEGTVDAGYIQAKKLDITNGSHITVDGEGVFISGDDATNISSDSTVTVKGKGHLLSAYDLDHNNRAVNIDGTVNMEGGIVRAASNADGSHYSQVNVNGSLNAKSGDNYLASRLSNIKEGGTIAIDNGATLTLAGDMIRNGDGTLGAADADKNGQLNVAKSGNIVNKGTLNSGTVKVNNNGTIAGGILNIESGYTSDGGYMGDETAESTISLSGDINLSNNARIVAATQDDKGSITISDAGNINVTNGSTIDAVELNIEGGESGTVINISGNNPAAERGDIWRNNAYILGYGDSSISNAEINLGNGGSLVQGAKGTNKAPVPGSMKLAGSTINVAENGLMKATNGSDFTLDNSTVNLSGRIEGIVKTENAETENKSAINVNSSNAYIEKIDSLDELNINTNTSSGTLFGGDSVIGNLNISSGNTFTLDKADEESSNLLTAENINVDGAFKLAEGVASGTDYTIANTNVNSGGVLDVATNEYTSTVTLNDGASLNIGFANEVDENGAVTGIKNGSVSTLNGTEGGSAGINLVFSNDIDTEKLAAHEAAIAGNGDNQESIAINDNLLFNYVNEEGEKLAGLTLDQLGEGKLNVEKKDASEVAAGVAAAGANGNQAGTIAGFTSGKSGNVQADKLTDSLSTMIQSGNVSGAAEIAEAVAPHAGAMVRSVQAENINQAYGAVSGRLSGGVVASAAEGKSSGDSVFERAAVWVQGLFNKSKLDDTSKARGFDADSYGLAFGAEKQLDNNIKAGIAYAYTDTDVDGHLRKTDIDTHTVMAYGEYKPSDWFVNGIASYGWSDYTEKKFGGINAKYDVDTYGLQAMTGYDMNVSGYNVTPEAGLRYVHISQDAYTDDAGQRVSANDLDILTAVAGAKVAKDFELANGMNLRPEARLAMTYDLANDSSNSIVSLANGSAYTVDGEALDRFGVEAGLGVTADIRDNLSVSAGYEGKFRDHYEDHTGLLSAKYKF